MRLRCNVPLLSFVLVVVGVSSGAESFQLLGKISGRRRNSAGVLSAASSSDTRRAHQSRRLCSAAIRLGVGVLGITSATLCFCSLLSSSDRTRSSSPRGSPTTSIEAVPTNINDNNSDRRPIAPVGVSSSSVPSPSLTSGEQQNRHQQHQDSSKMLEHTTDNYDGVTVDGSKGLPESTDAFKEVLESSLAAWKSAGRKGVWLKVPADRTELVPVAMELEFELHHAEKAYIMLNTWLPSTENKLPQNASHQVGVGALVLNKEGKVLVVREKNGPLRGTGIWKLPTGLIDVGEDLPDAAAREVLEETGVHVDFDSVLAFRHGHWGLFGKSDLFFVVRMRLKPGTDGSELVPQASEIEACQWMSRELFAEQNASSGTVLLRELSTIMEAHLTEEESGDSNGDGGVRTVAAFKAKMLESSRKYGGKSMLYHGRL